MFLEPTKHSQYLLLAMKPLKSPPQDPDPMRNVGRPYRPWEPGVMGQTLQTSFWCPLTCVRLEKPVPSEARLSQGPDPEPFQNHQGALGPSPEPLNLSLQVKGQDPYILESLSDSSTPELRPRQT